MVAAQHQGHKTAGQSALDLSGERAAGSRDLGQVLGRRVALGPGFGLFDVNIAQVFDLIPQRLHARVEAGDTQRRGPHVDPAASLAEIERRSDDGDV